MGSSKKHKDRDRDKEHKKKKRRSRSRSKERKHRRGDDERKRHKDKDHRSKEYVIDDEEKEREFLEFTEDRVEIKREPVDSHSASKAGKGSIIIYCLRLRVRGGHFNLGSSNSYIGAPSKQLPHSPSAC